jgi:hypothetical protein
MSELDKLLLPRQIQEIIDDQDYPARGGPGAQKRNMP